VAELDAGGEKSFWLVDDMPGDAAAEAVERDVSGGIWTDVVRLMQP
jgi:hypothetical protein